MTAKLPPSNKVTGNLAEVGAGTESYGIRNEVLPNPETMREELLAVLGYYEKNQDVDKSPLEVGQTNSQKAVIGKIIQAVVSKEYPTAQAILFREDIEMTPQMEEIALRINRLVQVAVRQGTTDSMEFVQAKKEIKIHEDDLVKFYKAGGQEEAVLILKNVSESLAGTREMGLGELEAVRKMVQNALKAEVRNNYEQSLPPHRLAGQEEGSKYINRSENPRLQEYLRLFDAITLEIMRQREIATDQSKRLTLERDVTLNFLNGLPKLPGVDFDENLRNEFIKKIAVMDLNQLMYFDNKIQQLEREMEQGSVQKDDANKEIRNWLQRDFTPKELHTELEEMKRNNEAGRAKSLEILRGKLRGTAINKPLTEPVRPEEYFN